MAQPTGHSDRSPDAGPPSPQTWGIRLHIGGETALPGWKILNVQRRPGVEVDFIGSCTDLSQFASGTVDQIYASHVYEHLNYTAELPRALMEAFRVLRPGGKLMAGVPDLEVLAAMILDRSLSFEERFFVQRMIMGGQTDEHDFHKTGFTFEILAHALRRVGFSRVEHVRSFGLVQDTTEKEVCGRRISLNVVAIK
jgi:predicted SAM-dependent methyltransferase